MKKSNKILAVLLALVMMLTAVPMMTAGAAETEPEAPAHTHAYVQQGEATKATCTEDGKATFKCECGDTVVRVVEVAFGHTPTTYESVDSNTHKTTCDTCKEEVVSNHNWNDGEVTKEATCSATGVKTYTCEDCEAKMNETIAMVDHTIVNGTGVAEATGNNHLVYCSVCKETITEEHKWEETVIEGTTKAPTCKDDGVKAFQCPVCTKVKTEVDPAGHKFDKLVEDKTDDKEHTYECSVCGEDDVAKAHTYKVVSETPATCKAKGEKISECEVCNHELKEELPTVDHKFGKPEQIDKIFHKQTCENEDCEVTVWFVHSWDEGKETLAPTCYKEGEKTLTCACGATKTEAIAKVDHKLGEWNVTKEPTFSAAGSKERACTEEGCEYKETEEIAKLEYQVGDINGDGKVQAVDARVVLQHVAGVRELEADELARADVDGNGSVQAVDARRILRIVVDLD